MGRPRTDTIQVTLRVPKTWLARIEQLKPTISRPGWPGCASSVTDVLRVAIGEGLDAIEQRTTSAKKE